METETPTDAETTTETATKIISEDRKERLLSIKQLRFAPIRSGRARDYYGGPHILLRREMKKGKKVNKFVAAVLPGNPPFDKVAALCLLIEETTGELKWPEGFSVEFYRSNEEPDQATRDRWASEKAYPVDIGNGKYHAIKAGSATEAVARDLPVDVKNKPELKWLITTANHNNKTGALKAAACKQNMPYVIRELYKPTMFVAAEDAVEMAAHVIFTEIKLRRTKPEEWTRKPYQIKACEEIADLVKEINYSREEFTFSHYLFAMFVLGEPMEEIVRRVEFWLENFYKATGQNENAIEKAKQAKWDFSINHHPCAYLLTDDDRLARGLFTLQKEAPSVIVTERRNGTFQLLSSRKFWNNQIFKNSLKELTEYLNNRFSEVGAIFFFDERVCAILNGTRSLAESKGPGVKANEFIAIISDRIQLPKEEPSDTVMRLAFETAKARSSAFAALLNKS